METLKFLAVGVVLIVLGLVGCQESPTTDFIDQSSLDGSASLGKAAGETGAVYTLSNDAAGNAVIRFSRSSDGSLSSGETFPTGGTGTGSGLGNQGGLVLEGNLLYAVNAGSDEISVMRERKGQLTLVSKVNSGGDMPISISVHGDLLYVVNAGGAGNIFGFTGASRGVLTPLAGSSRPLSGNGVGPAQIGFSPDGKVLIVTEKPTNKIDSYTIGGDGIANGPNVQNSDGQTPFGFAFDMRGRLVVSDAFGGAAGLSALSSYKVSRNGMIDPISGPVGNGQAAACWVAITGNGRFAYTTNTATSNISGYSIDHRGSLSLLDANGVTATTDAGPIDMAFSRDSQYLYTLNAGGHSITIHRVNNGHGGLTPLGSMTGLPASANGLAAQ